MKFADLGRVVGASAYELAAQQGYEGTLEEWLEGLKYDHSDEYKQLTEIIEKAKEEIVKGKADISEGLQSIKDTISNFDSGIKEEKEAALDEIEESVAKDVQAFTDYVGVQKTLAGQEINRHTETKKEELDTYTNSKYGDMDEYFNNLKDSLPEDFSTINEGLSELRKEDSRLSESITEIEDGYVSKDLMKNCELVEFEASDNLCDMEKIKQNTVCNYAYGTESENLTYCVLYLDVEEGSTLHLFASAPTGVVVAKARFVTAFDSSGNVVRDKGSSTEVSKYTIPTGITRVALSLYQRNINEGWSFYIRYNGEMPSEFIPYREQYSAYVATPEFIGDSAMNAETYLVDAPKNLLNPDECEINMLVNANTGAITNNNSYITSGFIKVKEGQEIKFCTRNNEAYRFRRICAYNNDKNVIASKGTNDYTHRYTVSSGVVYIRVSWEYSTSWEYFMPVDRCIMDSVNGLYFVDYTDEHNSEKVINAKYISATAKKLHVYLPNEIPVAIGRTVEIYNELVCLEAEKYHFNWFGAGCVQYKRKCQLYGRTAGNQTLNLNIYDDDMHIVWNGTTTVKYHENTISSEKKVLPIGDSLTNMKPWLSEVETLSNGKIKWIGTRKRTDQPNSCPHEGRSGFSASDYNANTSYTFDENYIGASDISGSVNPFWDGSKFSLSHYVDTQGSTVGIPDAVQLLLGTNDIAYDPSDNVENIKKIVDSIVGEYPSMHVFVCNTIYRSNQNGYYSAGADAYAGASDWQYSADIKIMNLQNALHESLSGYKNVHIVPLSITMDREHNFGHVEVGVNPRLSSVTEFIPNESVHPQKEGYLQMADVMYSAMVNYL